MHKAENAPLDDKKKKKKDYCVLTHEEHITIRGDGLNSPKIQCEGFL